MEPYIYTVSKKIHIIDLEDTERLLKVACEFLYKTASEGKTIIFVGTKKQSKEIIKAEALRSGAMFVNERWIGGTVTNFPTIKKNLDKLIKYIKGKETGEFDKYTKKERLLIDRQVEKMTLIYGGILTLTETPHVLFVIDPKRERTAIREAKVAGIPVVALVDTNADPTGIDYVIPANDDAIKSVSLLVKALGDAITEGYQDFAKKTQELKVKKEEEIAAAKAAKEAEEAAKAQEAIAKTTASESPVVTEEVLEIEEKLVEEKPAKIEVKAPKDDVKVEAAGKSDPKDKKVKKEKTKKTK